ncbi:MAG: endospore germination permease [Bacillota bacterium]|nr:endospore germination permease [Bacillota bacterium]
MKKEFINKFGIFSTIIITVVGVGFFSYPREITSQVGTDGWFVTLIMGLINYLFLYFIYKIVSTNSYNKFSDILENNFGKIAGKIVSVIFCIYVVVTSCIGLRIFAEVLKMYLLEKTPAEFIIFTIIVVSTYLIRGEISTLIKFNEIAFWIIFIPSVLVLIFTFHKADFTNVLPVFTQKPSQYINAITSMVYTFSGIEIAYLILPYVKDKKSVNSTIAKSMLFITTFFIVILICCLAVFGKDQTMTYLWPVITMIKTIDIPGTFVERWEGIVMSLWVLFFFGTFSNSYYFASDIIKDSFNLGDIKVSSMILIPFIFILSLIPQNISELYYLSQKIVPFLAAFCFIVFPLIFFIRVKLKRKGAA